MATARLPLDNFEREYGTALGEYLARGENTFLKKGYELGCEALTQGNGIIEMLELHHRTTAAILSASGGELPLVEALERSGNFLTEFVTPFESAQHGLSESNAALRRLNESTEHQAMQIAHALHDESGELLAAIHMRLDEFLHQSPRQTELKVEEMRQFLHEIEQQLKQLAYELRPTVLDDFGLTPAIQLLAKSVSRATGLQVSVGATEAGRFPMRIETAIYRFVQEALNNVTMHARARRAVVRLWRPMKALYCSVLDDGIGFNPADLNPNGRAHGLGLAVVRERLRAVGGSVEIISAPRRGTEVKVCVPIEV